MNFFDGNLMTAIAVASVNLKCGATLLQHLTWKVSQSRTGKAGTEYAAGLVTLPHTLLDSFKSQNTNHFLFYILYQHKQKTFAIEPHNNMSKHIQRIELNWLTEN